VLTGGDQQAAIDLLRAGFELSYRVLSYPKPVVVACTGPAIAMGSFLLCSGDHRIAAPGYNIQANEVAIGMILPHAASAIMKLRLTPSAYQQAAGLSKVFFGESALAAGFIDEIDLPERVLGRAQEAALEFTKLDPAAHAATKLRARAAALKELRAGIDGVAAEFGAQ
jgi:enoyl-CoA hydratase